MKKNIKPEKFLAVTICLLPVNVHAQNIPVEIAAAAISPLLVIVLAFLLGWISGNMKAGAMHALFIVTWVILFSLASYFAENDYIIWTPLAIYIAHSLLIIVLYILHLLKRLKSNN